MDLNLLFGTFFVFLGLQFLVIGVLINVRLARYFWSFYKNHSNILITATIGLSLPLLFRGGMDIYIYFDEELAKSLKEGSKIGFDIAFYVFTEIIPIIF